jgi:hypothetical protein
MSSKLHKRLSDMNYQRLRSMAKDARLSTLGKVNLSFWLWHEISQNVYLEITINIQSRHALHRNW